MERAPPPADTPAAACSTPKRSTKCSKAAAPPCAATPAPSVQEVEAAAPRSPPARVEPSAFAARPEQSACPLGFDFAVDATCTLRTTSSASVTTPKVKQLEAVLMSPTRRTGKKPNMRHWDYAAPVAEQQQHVTPPQRKAAAVGGKAACESPTPSAVVAAAVGALQVCTPAAVTAGLLVDADRT